MMDEAGETRGEKTYILPNGDQITVDELVALFKKEEMVPFPTSASIGIVDGRASSCRVQWSANNYERVNSVNFVSNYHLNYDDANQLKDIQELPGITELNNELASVISESGQYQICVSKSNGEQGNDGSSSNQRLDIWNLNENTIVHSIDVDSTKHGAIFLKKNLAGMSFSPDETKFAYVAEQKCKLESYFKDTKLFKDDEKKEAKNDSNETGRGKEYEYKQNWGEQLVDTCHTCVCILTLKPELKLKIIELPGQTLGGPFWLDDQKIGFIAYFETPKRLGMMACTNRIAYLYKCKLAKNDQETDDFKVIRGENKDLHLMNVQINRQKDKVVWFENGAGGPHMQAQKAMLWNLKTDKISTIFDLYEKDQPVIQSLFVLNVPPSYWTLDGEHVILSTINHSKQILFVLNVMNRTVRTIDFGLESASILNLKNNLLIIAASSPNQPPVVKIGLLDMQKENFIEFRQLREKYSNKDKKIAYRIIKQNEQKHLEQIETILISQADHMNTAQPAIIFIHGGPHVASLAEYVRNFSYFVRLGFKVAIVNYRGGLGISAEYVNQLCSNVGDMDVTDCVSAVNNLIDLNLIDNNNVHLLGGSHGGFLVTHLVGQYPDLFASCTARNPVTDLSKVFGATDIPDWGLIEAFGLEVDVYKKINNWPEENNLVKQLNRIIDVGAPELLKVMFDKSPIKHIDKVKTPVLIMLGEQDRRVPHSQGLSFFNALKVRNVETKCYLYQDNHPIGKTKNASDFTINFVRWLLKHSRISKK